MSLNGSEAPADTECREITISDEDNECRKMPIRNVMMDVCKNGDA